MFVAEKHSLNYCFLQNSVNTMFIAEKHALNVSFE